MLRKPELSADLMGHLARMQTLPYLPFLFRRLYEVPVIWAFFFFAPLYQGSFRRI